GNVTARCPNTDLDRTARRRMADGIREQIPYHLTDSGWVNFDGRDVAGDLCAERDTNRLGLGAERIDSVAYQCPHVGRFFVQDQVAGVGEDKSAQVFDEPVERLCRIEDRRQVS